MSSQGVHGRFGGVVPEWASRHHLELVNAVVDDALARAGATLDDIELIARDPGSGAHRRAADRRGHGQGPGAARGGCRWPRWTTCRATWRRTSSPPDPFAPPFVCLLASGGHTLLARVTDHAGYATLGQTLDDAAGEAFDKGARLLGLGYPGGPALSQLAADGDPAAFAFPTAARVAGLDFSFAGLKTALLYKVRDLGEAEAARRAADLAASYEHAIVTALMTRVERALDAEPDPRLAIGGGVAANRLLRARAVALGVPVHVPPRRAVHRQRRDDRLGRALDPRSAVPGLPRARRVRHRPACRLTSSRVCAGCPCGRGPRSWSRPPRSSSSWCSRSAATRPRRCR